MLSVPQKKLLKHSKEITDWLEGKPCRPIMYEIHLTNFCSADCPWCFYSGKHDGRRIDINFLMSALHMSVDFANALSWTGGGEPTLHPEFDQIVAETNILGYKQGLFTNGVVKAAQPEFFSWVRLSMTDQYFDALPEDTVRWYSEATKTGVCLNLTKDNAPMADDICKTAKEYGANYFQVRPALERHWYEQKNIELWTDLVGKYDDENFKVYVTDYKFAGACEPKPYSNCYGGRFCTTIDYDGNVRWCNYFLEDDSHIIGNIYKEDIIYILDRMPKYICVDDEHQTKCKHDECNKVLADLAEGIEDVDFL